MAVILQGRQGHLWYVKLLKVTHRLEGPFCESNFCTSFFFDHSNLKFLGSA